MKKQLQYKWSEKRKDQERDARYASTASTAIGGIEETKNKLKKKGIKRSAERKRARTWSANHTYKRGESESNRYTETKREKKERRCNSSVSNPWNCSFLSRKQFMRVPFIAHLANCFHLSLASRASLPALHQHLFVYICLCIGASVSAHFYRELYCILCPSVSTHTLTLTHTQTVALEHYSLSQVGALWCWKKERLATWRYHETRGDYTSAWTVATLEQREVLVDSVRRTRRVTSLIHTRWVWGALVFSFAAFFTSLTFSSILHNIYSRALLLYIYFISTCLPSINGDTHDARDKRPQWKDKKWIIL